MPEVQYLIALAVLITKSEMIRVEGRRMPRPPLEMVTCAMWRLCCSISLLFTMLERNHLMMVSMALVV